MEAELANVDQNAFPFLKDIGESKEQLLREITKKYLRAFQSVFAKLLDGLSEDQRKLMNSIIGKHSNQFYGMMSDKLDEFLENPEIQESLYDLYSSSSKLTEFNSNTLAIVTRVQSVKTTFMKQLELQSENFEHAIEIEVNGVEQLEGKCVEKQQMLRKVYNDMKNLCNNMCRKLEP